MVCAAIDIGSNTTRLLVAEPGEGRLTVSLEQRAYTRIKAAKQEDVIGDDKTAEVAEVVATQVRLAEELGAETIRIVATAAIRDASNGAKVAKKIQKAAGRPVEIISEQEEGRLAFIGATKTLGNPVDGRIVVVDVGGGSSEVVFGTVPDGVDWLKSFRIGSASLTEDHLSSDPPAPAEVRRLREAIEDVFDGVELPEADQAVAVGGSSTSLRKIVGGVLEYETLERAVRVLCGDPAEDIARRFELDPRRVRMLPSGVLVLEKLSELLGQPLQIGKGGLREGIVLDQMAKGENGDSPSALAA